MKPTDRFSEVFDNGESSDEFSSEDSSSEQDRWSSHVTGTSFTTKGF